jgi:hypothetical protein
MLCVADYSTKLDFSGAVFRLAPDQLNKAEE